MFLSSPQFDISTKHFKISHTYTYTHKWLLNKKKADLQAAKLGILFFCRIYTVKICSTCWIYKI